MLLPIAAFVLASFVGSAVRRGAGRWVPGWTGGISLLLIFVVFAVAGVAMGSPSWFESVFFVVVAAHVGFYLQVARTNVVGRWWEPWR